jgi:hypothetical protein
MNTIDNALRNISAMPTQREWADCLRKIGQHHDYAGEYVAPPNPTEAPMAVDVPHVWPDYPRMIPDTDQSGRAMLAMGLGAIIGGVVVVAIYAAGILL